MPLRLRLLSIPHVEAAKQSKAARTDGRWKLRTPEGVLGGAMREASRGCAIAVEAHARHKLLRATAA
jgi:hypothetical protein